MPRTIRTAAAAAKDKMKEEKTEDFKDEDETVEKKVKAKAAPKAKAAKKVEKVSAEENVSDEENAKPAKSAVKRGKKTAVQEEVFTVKYIFLTFIMY